MTRAILAAVCVLAVATSQAAADYVLLMINLSDTQGMVGAPAMGFGRPGMGRGGLPGGLPGGGRGRGQAGGFPAGPPQGRGPAMPGPAADLDEQALLAVAIVNIENRTPGGRYVQMFEQGKPIRVAHPWGEAHLVKELPIGKAVLLMGPDNKPLPSVSKQFEDKAHELFGNQPDTSKLDTQAGLALAEWCLNHGWIKAYVDVMDKLVEQDSRDRQLQVYATLRQALKKDLPEVAIDDWKGRLSADYSLTQRPHYTLLSGRTTIPKEQAEALANALEQSFAGFYYWWALKAVPLPLPQQKLLVFVTEKNEDFKRLQKILTPSAVVADAFFARREDLVVMAPSRMDDAYEGLKNYANRWWLGGFNRDAMLKGLKGAAFQPPGTPQVPDRAEAEMLAIVLKAMEVERARRAASHDGTRQLLFASGLLPRNVVVPEWFLFGMASFFETAPESPWPGIGARSFYWLPLFKEARQIQLRNAYDTLRQIVTDKSFRTLPPDGKHPAEHHAHVAAQRQVRAAAWALFYYLAQENRHGLRAYMAEMQNMPRDMELDDALLWGAFARAMGCVNAAGKPDSAKLTALANHWYAYMGNTQLESEEVHQEIHNERMQMAAALAARKHEGDNGQNYGGRGGRGGRGNRGGSGDTQPGGGQ